MDRTPRKAGLGRCSTNLADSFTKQYTIWQKTNPQLGDTPKLTKQTTKTRNPVHFHITSAGKQLLSEPTRSKKKPHPTHLREPIEANGLHVYV